MKTLTITLAIFALMTTGIAGQSSMKGMKGMAHKQTSAASTKGVQKATIVVNGGFKPDTINVKAGQPVQITFDTKHKACAATVVFPDLHMTKTLTDGKKTIVTFTPKKTGAINFACGMGMFKGQVIVK